MNDFLTADIDLSDAAIQRFEAIAADHRGIRIGVKSGGCSGLEYTMTRENSPQTGDRVFQSATFDIFIDAEAYTYLDGIQIDYQEDALSSAFIYRNPNAKGECGCGTSFSV